MEFPSTPNFYHQCGQPLNLSQVSNKAASSVDKEKPLKKYFIDFFAQESAGEIILSFFLGILQSFFRACVCEIKYFVFF